MTEPSDVQNMAGAEMSQEDKRSVKHYVKWATAVPFTFLLIVAAVGLELADVRGDFINYFMIIVAIAFLVLETIKVTRVDKAKFLYEMVVAAIGVAMASALLTYNVMAAQQQPALYHWVLLGVLFYDAIVTPYLSYSNALRDMSVMGGGGHE